MAELTSTIPTRDTVKLASVAVVLAAVQVVLVVDVSVLAGLALSPATLLFAGLAVWGRVWRLEAVLDGRDLIGHGERHVRLDRHSTVVRTADGIRVDTDHGVIQVTARFAGGRDMIEAIEAITGPARPAT